MKKLLAFLTGIAAIVAIFFMHADAANAIVQLKKANGAGYVTSFNMTFDSNTTSGNTIICGGAYNNDTAGTLSLSDNKGNTFNQIATGSSGGDTQGTLFYAYNITGGASHQITATMSANFHDIAVICREYSGLTTTDPLDKSSGTATALGTSHTSAATAATTQANELVVGFIAASANTTCTAGTNYGNVTSQNGSDLFEGSCMEDRTISSTGAQTATITTSASVVTYFIVATFKEVVAAEGSSATSSAVRINNASININGGTVRMY